MKLRNSHIIGLSLLVIMGFGFSLGLYALTGEESLFGNQKINSVNGLAVESDGQTLYVSQYQEDGRTSSIVSYHLRNRKWEGPFRLAINDGNDNYQPTLSPDGKKLFFVSKRPLPGTLGPVRQNIWFSRKGLEGWQAPEVITDLISPSWDGHAMLSNSGWLYFASNRPGGKGEVDIYKCKFQDGLCPDPLNVEILNSDASDNDIYLDPEERFIIFQRTFPNQPISEWGLDLYYSIKKNGQWMMPKPISAINTEENWELSPFVFPTCKTLYFKRTGNEGFLSIDLQTALGFDLCKTEAD